MLRVVFMGTPELAVPTLSELIASGHEIAAVYTQPPRPAGRGMAERPSPVHRLARASGLEVRTPASLKGAEAQAAFAALACDVAVVVAYGLLLPPAILAAPRHGCLNFHPSALPRWRGAAPIQRAIMAGDRETAAMVMRMDEGLDTGPICLAERVTIGPEMTAGELHDLMAGLGADLMLRALGALERESLECRPQPSEGACYAPKITKAECRIDWRRSAGAVHDHIRGLSPWPGAWFEVARRGGAEDTGGDDAKGARIERIERIERIKVLRSLPVEGAEGRGAPGEVLDDHLTIACGSGAVRLLELQRAGRKVQDAETFLRGFAIRPGMRLDSG